MSAIRKLDVVSNDDIGGNCPGCLGCAFRAIAAPISLMLPDHGNQIATTAPELVPRPLITIEALYSIAFFVGVLLPGWPKDSALLVG